MSLPNTPSPTSHPGGCYFLFNSIINWEAAEKLVNAASAACIWGFKEVTFCIGSMGGTIAYAFYVQNIFQALPIEVITFNVGDVRSAANVLFAAGDRRYASSTSVFFFHEAWQESTGQQNSTSASKRLQSLQVDDNRTVAFLSEKTGQPEAVVRGWHERDLTMNAADAVKFGVAQEVRELTLPIDAYVERIVVSG